MIKHAGLTLKRLFHRMELGGRLEVLAQHTGLGYVVVALRREVLHGPLPPHVVVARADGLRHAHGVREK